MWTTSLPAKFLMQHQQLGGRLAKATVATANSNAIIINPPAVSFEMSDLGVFMSWLGLALGEVI